MTLLFSRSFDPTQSDFLAGVCARRDERRVGERRSPAGAAGFFDADLGVLGAAFVGVCKNRVEREKVETKGNKETCEDKGKKEPCEDKREEGNVWRQNGRRGRVTVREQKQKKNKTQKWIV